MQQYELDFKKILTESDWMEWFQINFKFPDSFDKNWDAVEQCLRKYCENDCIIKITNIKSMPVLLKMDYQTFLNIILDFNDQFGRHIDLLQQD